MPAVAPKPLSSDQVIAAVAEFYSVTVAQIRGAWRGKRIALARHVAMYFARQLTESSYPDLGRSFGNRHHTTVIAGVRRIAARYKTDDKFCLQLSALQRKLERVS